MSFVRVSLFQMSPQSIPPYHGWERIIFPVKSPWIWTTPGPPHSGKVWEFTNPKSYIRKNIISNIYIYIPIPIDRILRITQGMSRLYICPKNVEKINTIQHLSIKTRWEPSDSTRADIFRALQKADPSQTPVLHHGLPLLVQIALGQRQGNLHHVLSPLRAEAKESTESKYETKMEPSKKNSYG